MSRAPAVSVPKPAVPLKRSDVHPVVVLLLEANGTNAGVIERTLAEAGRGGFRVVRVSRVTEALQRLARRDIEVVLVGQPLPDGDSRGAFDCLRHAAPDALILPMSGLGLDADSTASMDYGMDGILAKRREDVSWLPETLRYVTQRKRAESVLRIAEEALFEEKERARVTLSSIGDAVLVTDLRGNVTYLNPVAEALTGWANAEAAGRSLPDVFNIVDGATREPATDPAQRAIHEDRTVGLEANCILLRRDGSESGIEDSAAPVHDRHGYVSGAVIVFRDVSQSRAMTRKMAYLARHDTLTGLPNRALLNERLSQAVRLAHRHGKQAALLFVDLDDFKEINDTLGHQRGDHVLQTVANFLTTCVRTSDTVCRQGGDEFVILLAEIEKPDDAARVAEKLLRAFTEPVVVDGHAVRVAMSIGISIYPDDGDSADALMEHADRAMYSAKTSARDDNVPRIERKNRFVVPASIENNLQRAFEKGEFVLHYQPQIDVASGQVIGVEAFVRWLDPQRGLVHPHQFLALAEQSGLIVPIGHWILQEACRQARVWQAAGAATLPVAINVSGPEFRHAHFPETVAEVLHEAAMEPGCLELELTESTLMQDPETSAARLKALKDLGVHIALDDFGAGTSSLNHLGRFPLDTLKVDHSLMQDIDKDPGRAIILRSLIGLGRNLEYRVVAEGVESVEQFGFLKAQHCDAAQGFQLGRPLPADECSRLLLARQPYRQARHGSR